MKNFFKTLILALTVSVAASASAKETLKIYLHQPPGGFVDTMTRKIQSLVPENSKYNIVILNHPGAEGVVALSAFDADRSEHAIMFAGPGVYFKAQENEKQFQTLTELVPVAGLYEFGTTFAVRNSSSIKTWNDLIQRSKTQPILIGVSSGSQRIIVESYFANNPNVSTVSYNGDRNTVMGLLNETLEVANLTSTGAVTPVATKQIRGLLVTFGPSLNDVPSAVDLKVVMPYHPIFGGFVARKGTSKELVAEYNKLLTEITKHPDMVELYRQGNVYLPTSTSSEAFNKTIVKHINLLKK